MDSAAVKEYLLELQELIVERLEQVDGKSFLRDKWTRATGSGGIGKGEGISCIIEEGNVLERGGVAFSHVQGDKMPASATAHRPELAGCSWEAMGVSLVMHPRNPMHRPRMPTCACSLAHKPDDDKGVLVRRRHGPYAPYYGFEEDAIHFHQVCKNSLTPFDPSLHAKYKKWCDEYFFLKHRNEPRGVGGIFFDDLSEPDFESCFAIQQSVGDHYLSAYVPLLEKRKDMPYGERERDFQLYRRGRYVEFNLVIDRGTIFGLQSNGRTESILLSMPPLVKWRYDWHPEAGTPEAELYDRFLVPKDWV
ncbi:MAG: oxygen-dependent coproporphyrinogen oxidase [Nitrosomonadales bacterium]|nr:oxygen-dependent coproporphyrinogen oxidase [Nitrosomonadales bacterium]